MYHSKHIHWDLDGMCSLNLVQRSEKKTFLTSIIRLSLDLKLLFLTSSSFPSHLTIETKAWEFSFSRDFHLIFAQFAFDEYFHDFHPSWKLSRMDDDESGSEKQHDNHHPSESAILHAAGKTNNKKSFSRGLFLFSLWRQRLLKG